MAYTTIDKPSDYFNTVLYTGNGSTQSISGVNFSPDWVWIKCRNVARDHTLTDSVRGATKTLVSNSTQVESTLTSGLTSFDSDGFTLGGGNAFNGNTETHASWNWLAGGTASSNTDGSITSSVSANTTAGFSIVSYAGGGSDSNTVGHGLGTTPAMVIVKNRDNTNGWLVSHKGLTSESYNVSLNNTNAEETTSGHGQGIVTNKTSSTFGFSSGGVGDDNVNDSSYNYIAYCFAEKKGYSKFGSYTGNGNADGTFVYTGFKPAWVLFKKSSATAKWYLVDNKRDPFNDSSSHLLYPDSNHGDETLYGQADFLSNGVKIRSTDGGFNTSGATYIYMAFAESPFVTSTGIPTTAR